MVAKEIFAIRLLDLRERRKLSRQKVADDLNITRASLEYYEKGKRTPDVNTIVQIADYFGVSVDYLLGRTKSETQQQDLRMICDYFNTNVNTILGLKKITQRSKEYSEEFTKLLHSTHFTALLYHIYLSFDYKKELGELLVHELEGVTKLSEEDARELFDEFGDDGYSSSYRYSTQKQQDKIDLNEYRAQKELLALMNIFSRDCDYSDSYEDYVQWYVPTQKFIDDIYNDIDYCVSEINDKIRDFVEEQYLMDED